MIEIKGKEVLKHNGVIALHFSLAFVGLEKYYSTVVSDPCMISTSLASDHQITCTTPVLLVLDPANKD